MHRSARDRSKNDLPPLAILILVLYAVFLCYLYFWMFPSQDAYNPEISTKSKDFKNDKHYDATIEDPCEEVKMTKRTFLAKKPTTDLPTLKICDAWMLTVEDPKPRFRRWIPSKSETECSWVTIEKARVEPFKLCTYPPENDLISKFLHEGGTWEAYKTFTLQILFVEGRTRHFNLAERDIVIDIGANMGYFGFIAASAGYRVVMVEPSPTLVGMIAEGVKANHWEDRIEIYMNGVSNVRHLMAVGSHEGNYGANWMAAELDSGPLVHTVLLDDFVVSMGIDSSKVFAVKIDTSGYDLGVIDGAYNLLKDGKIPIVALEISTQGGCETSKLIDLMYALEYQAFQEGNPSEILSKDSAHKIWNGQGGAPPIYFVYGPLRQELVGHIINVWGYNP
mmetsp:Transcript_16766/g.23324  ORF Transcript_16766/g.23324 Transcript_16766/m.23324 type:complete len:393 (-) Transcript_16766:33-1211(-)